MKEMISVIGKDNIIKFSLATSLLLFFITALLVFLNYSRLPSYIPFFNSMPWGKYRFGSSQLILLIPAVSLFVILLNTFLSLAIYRKDTLVARILSVNALLFVFFAFLAFLQIVLLVF